MNRNYEESIRIKEKLIARASAEHYRKKLATSDFARGAYCNAEINCRGVGSVLCVFLKDDGAFAEEVMLNRDYGKLHERICTKVFSYSKTFSSKKVFIGRRKGSRDDIDYLVAGSSVICGTLKREGIELMGYYVTDGVSFENILPERG